MAKVRIGLSVNHAWKLIDALSSTRMSELGVAVTGTPAPTSEHWATVEVEVPQWVLDNAMMQEANQRRGKSKEWTPSTAILTLLWLQDVSFPFTLDLRHGE